MLLVLLAGRVIPIRQMIPLWHLVMTGLTGTRTIQVLSKTPSREDRAIQFHIMILYGVQAEKDNTLLFIVLTEFIGNVIK